MADLLGTATPWEEETTSEERTMGMIVHLSALILGFLGPLIFWLIKKDESRFIDDHGKEALNFAIVLNVVILAMFATCVLIPLTPIVGVYGLVLIIVAGVKANDGNRFRFPFLFRLIK